MFSKSFVSIYFLSDRVLILQLSSNKKKIKRHGQVILPEGMIKNYRIQDADSFSRVLSSAWSKLHIKEKFVGMVIPEFSTFTKYFKLPSLSVSEIDEAVRWQAQEYFPGGPESMVLDWKISEKSTSNLEVMTVAVDKEILSEYIKVVEKAGLLPMKIETPSICLLRYSKEEGGRMIIYRNYGETILVLSEGKKIIGTSIQHTENIDSVLRDASKMLNHYSDVKVDEVLVGGEKADQYSEKVADVLKRKVKIIDPGIDGIGKEEVQKNLIPISLQYEDVEQPSDPMTLNLLPETLVDRYKLEKLKIQAWSLTLTITLFVWISFFVALGSYLFMIQSINDIKNKNVDTAGSSVGSVDSLKEIESINDLSQKVLNIKKISIMPQEILNEIYLSKPAGVSIQKYDLDLEKGEVRLQGRSADRTTLIRFKESLEGKSDVDRVQIPISSFEAETNLDFYLTFIYLPISSTVKERSVKVNPVLR